MEPVKKGWQTSEFWLSLVAGIMTFLFASGVIPVDSIWDKVMGIAATILTSLGYVVSRTLVKKAGA